MILTEEEAKTKRCQEGYAASPGASLNPTTDYVHQTMAVPVHSMHGVGAYGVAHTATTAAPITAPIMCLGSACMAWRWYTGLDRMTGENVTYSHQKGYCGKAGKP